MTPGVPLRLVVADDHALFRQGLVSMLRLHPWVEVVAELERASDLVSTFERIGADVLLLDLQMERSALCDVEALAARVSVVVVTATTRVEEAVAALRAGARAIVFKRFAVETLLAAIDAVVRGQMWLPADLQMEVMGQLQAPRVSLTPREREVAGYVARGLRNAEVAERLEISEVTVKTHVNNIFHKLGLRDRVELALYAVRVGIIAADERPGAPGGATSS